MLGSDGRDLRVGRLRTDAIEEHAARLHAAGFPLSRLGVQSMGSAGTTFGRAFVQQAGLDPEKDVSFLPIGVGAQAVTSVRQKLVDGVVYWDAALAKLRRPRESWGS